MMLALGINGNRAHLPFTTDGLFVATLFKDSPVARGFLGATFPCHSRDVSSDLTLGEENFWPSITQTEDGQLMCVTIFPSIIRVDGLDSIRRLFSQNKFMSPRNQLPRQKIFLAGKESSRQRVEPAAETLMSGQQGTSNAGRAFLRMGPQTICAD